MSWDTYAQMITNVWDYPSQKFSGSGIGQFGAIIGYDGTLWAATPGFALTAYDYSIQLDETNTKTVAVDEVQIYKSLLLGDSRGGEAGIRLNQEKFMVTSKDGPRINLSKKGGGAIILKSKQCSLIGVWTSASKDFSGKF